jgi:hypothetical protein
MTISATPNPMTILPDVHLRAEPEQRFVEGTAPSVEGTAPSGEETQCDVCPHSVAGHDAISSRFCGATLKNALTRGCVCRSA